MTSRSLSIAGIFLLCICAQGLLGAEEADLGRYWAGHKVVLSTETDGDYRDCQLTIKYSNDGLMYSASVEVDSFKAEPGGKCSGKVDKFGNLERKECTPGDWQQRDIVGTVWAPKYDNVYGGRSGGCQWEDQTLLITKKTLSKGKSEEVGKLELAEQIREPSVYVGERISKEMVLKHFVGPTWEGEFKGSGDDIELKYEKGGDLEIYVPNYSNTLYGTWKVDDKGTVCTEFDTAHGSTYSSCRYYEYSNKPPGITVFLVSGGG